MVSINRFLFVNSVVIAMELLKRNSHFFKHTNHIITSQNHPLHYNRGVA